MFREEFLENDELKLHSERTCVEGRDGHVRMKGQHAPMCRNLQQNVCPRKYYQFMMAEAEIDKGYLEVVLDTTNLSMRNPSFFFFNLFLFLFSYNYLHF